MGLLTIKTEAGFDKLYKNIIIESAEKPKIIGSSTYVPYTDAFRPPENLTIKRLFWLDRNVQGNNLFVPDATLGRVFIPHEITRHLLPTAVVLLPSDRRAKNFGIIEVDLAESTSMDTESFCMEAVACALLRMDEHPLVELSGIPTS